MRLIGVDIPDNKRIAVSLRYIYGIGPSLARRILEETEVDPNIRTKELSDEQLTKITGCIQKNKFVIEGDLRREIAMNLKRLMAVNCYRGIRHRKGLPVRGQRTQTNARTRKGPRKTVGVVRSKDAKTGKV
jgi:small subunit ribosomal protein S13